MTLIKLKFLVGALFALTLMTQTAAAAGDAAAGKEKSATCAACHGADGNSVNPQWPSLAGQNASYIVKTLQAFKDGTRSDPLMSAQANMLTDDDIANLAAFYESQKPVGRTANPELAKLGERLYRGGSEDMSLTACIGCHGPAGRGNLPAGYPALAGQHATYTAKQLADYQSDARKSDGDTKIMRNVAARLTQKEIDALAAYLQGLR